ncbi:uncharacterized protein LOC115774776 isoform X2 [Archocentrus centrarchus]|uniref:uncharacterized protein LOC115774776 isoform X2 n=1 Tax=Archocentrus centrarchus TaxID=63155 RepID=UPI0011EA0C75|nr:uncharacterized protein LOC115774776 isoform X2 [Archocentrus centrarchus]
MDEFRWIQMFLCLMLIIPTADDQNNCDGTTWIFGSRSKPTVELIRFGRIGEEDKTESDRLSVTANCSLDIKQLTAEDAGLYYCQQYKLLDAQAQRTRVHQSVVHLSVITLTEHKDNDKVVLNCSVLTYDVCHHTLRWGLKSQIEQDNNQIVTSQTPCSISMSFPESHYLYPSRYNILKCEVTDTDTENVQLFTFSPQPSFQETGDTKSSKKPTRKTESSTKSETTIKYALQDFFVSLRFIIVSVGLAALLITAVTVNIWTRAKGNKAQMDKTTVQYDEDDDVSINYENIGYSAASVRLH